jgi:hypothetical protein
MWAKSLSREKTEKINPDRTVDQSQTRFLRAAFPNADAVTAEHSFPALGSHEELHRPIHNGSLGPESCEFAGLPDQHVVDFNVGSAHKLILRQNLNSRCIDMLG